MIFSNQSYIFLNKPQWLSSSFGDNDSILDYFDNPQQLQTIIQKESELDKYSQYFYLDWFQTLDLYSFLENQKINFTKDQEYWLLNRLDQDTGWFLYFAKTQLDFDNYKLLQSQHKIQKAYLAIVHWNPFYQSQKSKLIIDTALMHHKFDDTKMISLENPTNQSKWRWKIHNVSTQIELINYDSIQNQTLILATIHKWIRHQIRAHCKSIGSPIVWDQIYWRKKDNSVNLKLWSIWIR